MRMNYIKTPTDYVGELKSKGLRQKAMAFQDYVDDMERGDHHSIRFYAKAWSIGKSTADRWIDDFKKEIDLFLAHWDIKNKKHYTSAKKQVGQMGHQEGDKRDSDKAQDNETYTLPMGQMGHQEGDKDFNKDDTNSARMRERFFDDLFNIYNLNSDFPGSKADAYEVYMNTKLDVEHKDLVTAAVLYLHDPKREGKLNNLSNFLKNEVYINYMPKHIRVFTKGVWINGEYDRENQLFTSTAGDQQRVPPEIFTSKFTKGEIEFIHEDAA